MSILKQLLEMDPFMRPIGGPIDDDYEHLVTEPETELVVPDQRFIPLLQAIMNRSTKNQEPVEDEVEVEVDCEELEDDDEVN